MLTKRRFAYGLVCLLLSLVLAEVCLRFWLGLGTPVLLEKHATIGYVFAANQDVQRFSNHISINAYHQRSSDITTQPDTSTLRILFLGDSVTFGGTLSDQDQTITAYLEPQLQNALEQRIQVLNASAGSWGIGNMEAYADAFGLFGSHVVVLQIGTHDLLQPQSTSDPVGVHPSMPDKKPLTAISELITRYLIPRVFPSPPSPDPITWPIAQQADQFAANIQVFDALVDAIQGTDTPVLVVHTPNRDEVVRDVQGRYADSYATWRAAFLQHCAEQAVPVLNLVEAWKTEEAVNAYFRDGVHFEPEGNAAAARILLPILLPLLSN